MMVRPAEGANANIVVGLAPLMTTPPRGQIVV